MRSIPPPALFTAVAEAGRGASRLRSIMKRGHRRLRRLPPAVSKLAGASSPPSPRTIATAPRIGLAGFSTRALPIGGPLPLLLRWLGKVAHRHTIQRSTERGDQAVAVRDEDDGADGFVAAGPGEDALA